MKVIKLNRRGQFLLAQLVGMAVLIQISSGKGGSSSHGTKMLSRGQQHVVNMSSKVLLECEFTMEKFNLFDNPIVWEKQQQQNDRVKINLNGAVQEPFATTRRYDVELRQDHSHLRLTLKIKDTNLEDSGNYTCELRGRKSLVLEKVTHSLSVRAPIKLLYILTNVERSFVDAEVPIQTLVVNASQPISLKCLCHGGFPAPQLSMHINGRDITDRFQIDRTTDFTGHKGLRKFHYRSSCWTSQFLATPEDDGGTIQCSAFIPGIGTNSSNVTLVVNYVPRISCNSVEAELGEDNVQFVCSIKSRPEPLSLYWIIDTNGTVVTGGDVSNEYYNLVRDKENNEWETILYLGRVYRENFRQYSLFAENIVGKATHNIELKQKFSVLSNNREVTSINGVLSPDSTGLIDDDVNGRSMKGTMENNPYHWAWFGVRSRAYQPLASSTPWSSILSALLLIRNLFGCSVGHLVRLSSLTPFTLSSRNRT